MCTKQKSQLFNYLARESSQLILKKFEKEGSIHYNG